MSAAWFLAGLLVGGTIGTATMALLAAHGRREKRAVARGGDADV